jgi:hypothetical protein
MNIRIGIWAGGDPGNAEGTIEWAGGETDYKQAPYTMVVEKVEVRNEHPGNSYSYGDLSGGFESIVVDGKEGDGDKAKTSSASGSVSASGSPSASAASSTASVSATVNVKGGLGGEWVTQISNGTGAVSSGSMGNMSSMASATASAAVVEQTASSGAVARSGFGGGCAVLLGAMAVMLWV